MKLIYDVAVMAQLVAACQSANTEIVKAEQLVQQVRSHGDWTCKEKSVIDELMQDCKSLVQRMREDQGSFLRVLKDVEGELNDTENSVSNLFSGVESILGKVLGIPVAIAHVAGGGLLGAASAIANSSLGSAVTQAWNQWTEGIDIQNQMMDQFNPDHVGVGLADDFIKKMKEIGQDILDTDVIWHGPAPIDSRMTPEFMEFISSQWNNATTQDTAVNMSGIAGLGNFEGVLDSVGNVVSDIGSGIGGMLDHIGIGDYVNGIGEGIGNVSEKISEGIGDYIQGIGNVINGTETPLMQQMREQILQGRTDYGSTIPNFENDFSLNVMDHLAKVSDPIAVPIVPISHIPVDQNVTDVVSGVTGVVGNVTDVVSDVWAQIQDSSIGDAVQDALRNLTEVISVCDMGSLKL